MAELEMVWMRLSQAYLHWVANSARFSLVSG
jgi:hypothetical protein